MEVLGTISRFEALKYGGIRNTSFENMEVLGTLVENKPF
jgi:hypothetical protein